MSFSNLLFFLPLLLFLPTSCFLGRVDVIDEPTKAATQENGTQQKQKEIETSTKATNQFQIEEIGRSEQKEKEENISTNGSQTMSCQCEASSKRNITSGPQLGEIWPFDKLTTVDFSLEYLTKVKKKLERVE